MYIENYGLKLVGIRSFSFQNKKINRLDRNFTFQDLNGSEFQSVQIVLHDTVWFTISKANNLYSDGRVGRFFYVRSFRYHNSWVSTTYAIENQSLPLLEGIIPEIKVNEPGLFRMIERELYSSCSNLQALFDTLKADGSS